MPSGIYLTQEQIDFVRKNFANTPNKELAENLGVSITTINNVQKKYRLTKSPEHLKAMHRISGLASAKLGLPFNLTPEIIRKRAETFKKTHKLEKARVHFGLTQKTKIKIQRLPKDMINQRRYLRERGYAIDDTNLIAYYNDATKRSNRLEAIPRGQKKGVIKSYYEFKSYEEKQ